MSKIWKVVIVWTRLSSKQGRLGMWEHIVCFVSGIDVSCLMLKRLFVSVASAAGKSGASSISGAFGS